MNRRALFLCVSFLAAILAFFGIVVPRLLSNANEPTTTAVVAPSQQQPQQKIAGFSTTKTLKSVNQMASGDMCRIPPEFLGALFAERPRPGRVTVTYYIDPTQPLLDCESADTAQHLQIQKIFNQGDKRPWLRMWLSSAPTGAQDYWSVPYKTRIKLEKIQVKAAR